MIAGFSFPVLLYRHVFKNNDGSSTDILYPVYSNLDCDAENIMAIYRKRWEVELFLKVLKSNASVVKSPAHAMRTVNCVTSVIITEKTYASLNDHLALSRMSSSLKGTNSLSIRP